MRACCGLRQQHGASRPLHVCCALHKAECGWLREGRQRPHRHHHHHPISLNPHLTAQRPDERRGEREVACQLATTLVHACARVARGCSGVEQQRAQCVPRGCTRHRTTCACMLGAHHSNMRVRACTAPGAQQPHPAAARPWPGGSAQQEGWGTCLQPGAPAHCAMHATGNACDRRARFAHTLRDVLESRQPRNERSVSGLAPVCSCEHAAATACVQQCAHAMQQQQQLTSSSRNRPGWSPPSWP